MARPLPFEIQELKDSMLFGVPLFVKGAGRERRGRHSDLPRRADRAQYPGGRQLDGTSTPD
jgi:hypothetical protein